jgi:hypothetical protein
MPAIKSLALALILITSMEAQAAPISVSCLGMAERKITQPARYPDTVSITVDLANKTLTLENDGERFPITTAIAHWITANGRGNWGNTVSILLDRATGKLSIEIFNDKRQLTWDFTGRCELVQRSS